MFALRQHQPPCQVPFHTLFQLDRHYEPYCIQEGKQAQNSYQPAKNIYWQQMELGIAVRTLWFKALTLPTGPSYLYVPHMGRDLTTHLGCPR